MQFFVDDLGITIQHFRNFIDIHNLQLRCGSISGLLQFLEQVVGNFKKIVRIGNLDKTIRKGFSGTEINGVDNLQAFELADYCVYLILGNENNAANCLQSLL